MELPDPLTPGDSDLRDFAFMPLLVARLRRSKAWLIAKRQPELGFYMVNLWTAAWHDFPAGSLEDDDDVLSDLAMCDPRKWERIRDKALHGWVKCSDGRLYHPVVAEQVNDAWANRQGYRERLARARAAKAQKQSHSNETPIKGSMIEPVIDSIIESIIEPETGPAIALKGQGQGQGEGYIAPKPPRGPRSIDADPECAAFYAAYPRHDAPDDAFKAWRQVIKAGAKPADIMAGLARYQFPTDRQFIKLPASWLRAGCWKSDEFPLDTGGSEITPSNPTGRRILPMTGYV